MRKTMTAHIDTIDLFFRDFLHKPGIFKSPMESKSSFPVDIYETKQGMFFEIPCVGFSKEDVNITVKSDILNIKYENPSEKENYKGENRKYYCKGVARRSFDIGYKFSSKFDLTKVDASYENGLLTIHVPYSKQAEPIEVTIR